VGKDKGILGNLFGNDTVLWFIILFLLIFWCCGYLGGTGYYREEKNDIGLNLD